MTKMTTTAETLKGGPSRKPEWRSDVILIITGLSQKMFPNTFYFICFSDLVQIERASAGNMKLTSSERASDPDQPDDFGYTQSKFTPQCLQGGYF